MTTERRYGQWAGNPRGIPEDKTRCIESVHDNYKFRQCLKKRGKGPNGEYCGTHAKLYEERKS